MGLDLQAGVALIVRQPIDKDRIRTVLRQLRTLMACLLAVSVMTTGTLQSARAWLAGSAPVSADVVHQTTAHAHHRHGQVSSTARRGQLECLLVCLDGVPSEYMASSALSYAAPQADVSDFDYPSVMATAPRLGVVEIAQYPRGPPDPDLSARSKRHAILLLTARFRI